MQWFADAKLGIFIHWGIYAVRGIPESWSFFNNYINYKDYKDQLSGFTASNYNPQQWVKAIQESGAKYAVITSKHHDGISSWNSKQSNALTIPMHSAAKRDVLTPFVKGLEKSGLKTGIYFSLPDWSYPDYDVFTSKIKRYDLKKEPERFQKFIQYYQGQLKEISTQFKPDLLWFDGDWEHSAEEWKAKESKSLLQQYNPNIIVNSRLQGNGDYATPEQGVPVQRPGSHYWELCYTMNDSWGYQPFDKNYKTPFMIIKTLVDCISMGGNLLLDIGPKPDGTIADEQLNILKQLGRWTKKHAEAIYGIDAGINQKYFPAKSALAKDRKALYLYLTDDQNGLAWLKGIQSRVEKITVVGTKQNIPFEKEGDNYWITIPPGITDQEITVLKVELGQPLKLAENIRTEEFSTYIQSKNSPALQLIKRIAQDLSIGNNPFKDAGMEVNKNMENINKLPQQVEDWANKHAEVFANTGKGLSEGHYAGLSSLSADKQTVYLFVEGTPTGPLALKGISNNIARVRIVGEGNLIEPKMFDKLYWSATPGIQYIDIPKNRLDKYITVIAVLLDGPLREYRQEVKPIESNL